ncbi:UNVERIFIED_CONTAM: 8-oxo-dGTP pyrophosphatase MutT (NUDIX family) [Brevibacillus sp. OAP136]
MEYVKEMRKLIGTKPLLICGAGVLFFDDAGRVLMLQRSDNLCWCFPGGTMDLGEQLEQTARREALEETGLTVQEMTLFGVFSGKGMHYVYPHGDEVYVVDAIFTCNRYEGTVQLNDESINYAFFEIDRLPDEISPPVRPIVQEVVKRFGKSQVQESVR